MDRNSVKFRIIRFSTWTAIGLALLAIGLIAYGAKSKEEIGLHLTVWGIQIMLSATVFAVVAAILRMKFRRIVQSISQLIANAPGYKDRSITTYSATLDALMNRYDETDEEENKDKPIASPYLDSITAELEPGGSPWKHQLFQDGYDGLHGHK